MIGEPFWVIMHKRLPPDGTPIVAWYTPDVEYSAGPEFFKGPPGLILELDLGNRSYLVKEVTLDPDLIIEHPSVGELISMEDFKLLAE